MNQDQLIILLFKVTLLADVLAVAAFIAVYWRLAPWYKNPIGRTIVIEGILLILMLTPSLLSLFLHFNRLTSHIAAWVDIGLFALLAPVMLWRCAVWIRIHRAKRGDEETPSGKETDGN